LINSPALERAGDNHREGRKMANRENKISVILYEDTIDALIAMPDGSMSEVMKSILCRAKGKESPELDALESVIFRLLYGQVERASNLSDERAKAGASKGKKAAQAQTEDTGNQNVSNDEQTEATDKQIEANAIKAETKPNTSTSTSTVTKTKTSTVTDTSTSTGGVLGGDVREPVQTITAGGRHHGVVITQIVKAESGAHLLHWPKIRAMLNEYCGYRFGEDEVLLFRIGGVWYFMADIGLRMLTPRELYRANGFPEDYQIERDCTGREYSKTKQVARCGNAVPPPFAAALVRANLPEWCHEEISTMAQLVEMVAV